MFTALSCIVRRLALAAFLMSACCAGFKGAVHAQSSPSAAKALSDQDISDAWIYLFGRLLVIRQQQLDFRDGFKWNELVHRKPGAVDWPNPNLDVAYSEAWVAADASSCTIVTVPKITGRYYTVQFLNGWGETLANLNERLFPNKPDGDFAICLRGADVTLPADVRRIDFPIKYSRVLLRVELGDNWDDAVRLQRQFTMRATGTPALPTLPNTPGFDLEKISGVEVFDVADIALDSEADLNPGLEKQAANARAIQQAIREPGERARLAKIVEQKAHADFARYGPPIGHGVIVNGWARPAVVGIYDVDYIARTLINYGGIWAN
ncbi:DUF1254 domain-containing protein, partial [Tardiphaga sp.]|uniref:DUF1254 domain-containing protein n=1 Tax=Tardiphaga sp. TaxID=1926292 RepID=UPI0037D9CD66